MINISICLSDIPKEAITTSKTNGKKYLSLIVDERKEKDNYGNTHSVALSQTKEQREAKEKKVYLGNGKEYIFGGQKQQPSYEQLPDEESSELPF
jgi:hypothetical protein